MNAKIIGATKQNGRWYAIVEMTRRDGIVERYTEGRGEGYRTKKAAMDCYNAFC